MKSQRPGVQYNAPNLDDPNAFSACFREYYAALCYFAQRMLGDASDAEDVVEELFVRLWSRQQTFADEGHLKAFLYRSTKNACLDFIKKSERSGERNTFYVSEVYENDEGYLNEIIRTEVIRELYQAIDDLPTQCNKVIKMSYVEGKTNQEIADELSLSLQTVKNHKARGLAMLKNSLPADKYQMLLLIPYLELFDLLSRH
ncbi:MAG: RNA polymerase sigma-70 factor [Bacteroidetes bacterium]|nr:RNA polymerase sigma-70 factor [Bacteroidota bacterium]